MAGTHLVLGTIVRQDRRQGASRQLHQETISLHLGHSALPDGWGEVRAHEEPV